MHQEIVDELSELVATGQIDQQCCMLGEGLSGKVYEYEHVAVKVFKEKASEDGDDRILSRLHQHPAFPTLYHRGDRFMVMDKVEGITLAQELHNRSRLKESYLQQIEAYTEDCFREGWIPRDMHLNNLMVDAEDRIRIVDVGRFIHTDHPERFKEELTEDLEDLRYDLLGLFSPFDKKRRYRSRSGSSDSYRRRRYSSSDSYRRRRYHSSGSYSSSRRRYRKYRRRARSSS